MIKFLDWAGEVPKLQMSQAICKSTSLALSNTSYVYVGGSGTLFSFAHCDRKFRVR